jgi:hypothetical protein
VEIVPVHNGLAQVLNLRVMLCHYCHSTNWAKVVMIINRTTSCKIIALVYVLLLIYQYTHCVWWEKLKSPRRIWLSPPRTLWFNKWNDLQIGWIHIIESVLVFVRPMLQIVPLLLHDHSTLWRPNMAHIACLMLYYPFHLFHFQFKCSTFQSSWINDSRLRWTVFYWTVPFLNTSEWELILTNTTITELIEREKMYQN